jgi:hypothetical protein
VAIPLGHDTDEAVAIISETPYRRGLVTIYGILVWNPEANTLAT